MMVNYIAKFIILGEAGCGKTSIIDRYIDDQFSFQTAVTIGTDFKTKKIPIHDLSTNKKVDVSIQIWDTAGQERFNSIINPFYRFINGVILLFDISNVDSLEKIRTRWLPQVDQYCPDASIILVGNKYDHDYRKQSITDSTYFVLNEAEKLSRERGLTFLTCSARTGEGINEIFIDLLTRVISRVGLESLRQKESHILSEVMSMTPKLKDKDKDKGNCRDNVGRGLFATINKC